MQSSVDHDNWSNMRESYFILHVPQHDEKANLKIIYIRQREEQSYFINPWGIIISPPKRIKIQSFYDITLTI